MKLFCISYAGGSQFYFHRLRELLSGKVDCILPDYAGHGLRAGEKLAGSLDEMIEDIDLRILRTVEDGERFAVFGYSMGSTIAYEIAKRHRKDVSHLFVAAFQPPNHFKDSKFTLNESSWDEFLKKFTVLDERVLSDPRYRKIFLDPLKNDFLCLCAYQPDNLEKVDCGISVFYGDQDVFGDEILEWKQFSKAECSFHAFTGGHFFL